MKYFYIHPFKPQFFFPEAFKKHKVFLSFFEPYSLKGSVSWFLFRHFWLYRICFKKNNIEPFIPEEEIRKVVGFDALMAFNTGTPGPERKITALGLEKNSYFFIKFGNTHLAIENVTNEHKVLQQLSHLNFVPKVQGFYINQNSVILKTDVLTGERLGNVNINDSIFSCLIQLSKQKNVKNLEEDKSLITVFAHGDFCPWNMMEKDKKIMLFDWEMAGDYPLAYDLFTFIFQTQFLLAPEKSISLTLNESKKIIDKYFQHFNIYDWSNYLKEFCLIKIKLETKKGEKGMLSQYNALLNYGEKT